MYQEIGLTDEQADIYEFLIDHHIREASHIAAEVGSEADAVYEAVARLGALGLVAPDPDRPGQVSVLPPELAVGVLIDGRESQLRRLRLHAASLADRHRSAALRAGAQEIVEIVRGRGAIAAQVALLEQGAQDRVESLSAPPYDGGFGPSEEELDLGRRGITARVVYAKEALEQEGAREALLRLKAVGEQARMLARVPMKLLLVDRRMALVPLTTGEQETAILVRPSSLLDALIALFETFWERAQPLDGWAGDAGPAGLTREELRLVNMLVTGMKDETAARHLGLGVRTARRRIAAIMDGLGANTRFQAGYLLGRSVGCGRQGERSGHDA